MSQRYDDLWRQAQYQSKQDYDLQFYERNGYWPEQTKQVQRAQDLSQQEYEQLIGEIQAAMSRMDQDPIAQMLMQELQSGRQPYDPETLNALVSEAVSPIMGGAAGNLSRLRENFASRGLGRSGGLGSLEAQLMQDAIRQSALASSGLRAQGALGNYQAWQQNLQNAQNFYGQQASQRNQLVGLLANTRAQKVYDPNMFMGGRNANMGVAGSGYDYSPPPPIERRRVGTTAPKYQTKRNDPTGAWGVGR